MELYRVVSAGAPLPKGLSALAFNALLSAGFDNIDRETCKTCDIKVASVQNYGASILAELFPALTQNDSIEKIYRQVKA